MTLTNASNNICGLECGNLNYVDANDINIGTVGGVNDISVSGTITLTATAGSINDAADDNTVDSTAGGLIPRLPRMR